MKKYTLIIAVILISLPVISQGRKYNRAMKKAMGKMEQTTDKAGSLACADDFETIANAYPDQWIPYYYAAQLLTTSTMEEQDIAKGDAQLDRARKLLDSAQAILPEESELKLLEALLILSRMSLDPGSRGPIYFEDVNFALQRAKALNPDNPRVYFLEGMIALNMPDFMGGGPDAARPIFLEAESKFKAFNNDNPYWPGWGEDLVLEELEKLSAPEQ